MSIARNSAIASIAGRNAGSSLFSGMAQDNGPANQNRTPAQFWMNVGYQVMLPDEDGNNVPTFISLATGIPLDGITPFDIGKSRTQNMAALREAQNNLHAVFMAAAEELEPGESRIVIADDSNGLAVEIRRVKGDVEAPAKNTLLREIKLR